MKYIKLLFENNKNDNLTYSEFNSHFRLVKKGEAKFWKYENKNCNFSGKDIRILLECLNYLFDNYKCNIPILLKLNEIILRDKLILVILECICYYLTKYAHRYINISFRVQKSIWCGGINFSCLNHLNKEPRRFCKEFFVINSISISEILLITTSTKRHILAICQINCINSLLVLT